MTFDNGNTVSVQWGNGNYCNNRDLTPGSPAPRDACQTAEIAAWDSDDNWYDFGHDNVKGWCTPNDAAAFIQLIATTKIRGGRVDEANICRDGSGS